MLTLYLGTTSRLLVFGKTRTYHCFNGTRTKVMKLKRCLFSVDKQRGSSPKRLSIIILVWHSQKNRTLARQRRCVEVWDEVEDEIPSSTSISLYYHIQCRKVTKNVSLMRFFVDFQTPWKKPPFFIDLWFKKATMLFFLPAEGIGEQETQKAQGCHILAL